MEEKIIKSYMELRREQNPAKLGYVDMQELYKKLKPLTIAKFK